MQSPVDLANLMNERSVRRPHALHTPDMTCVCAAILDNSNALPSTRSRRSIAPCRQPHRQPLSAMCSLNAIVEFDYKTAEPRETRF